jgi:integrase
MAGKRGHGEGTIRHRTDKDLWEGMYSYRDETGKLKRRSVYGKTQREASEKLRAALRTIDMVDTPITDRQTVAQFLDRWLTDVAHPKLRPSTYASYQQKVRLYIAPALGRYQLAKLKPQQVQAMMNGMQERGLSPRSVQYARAILRRALNQALKWGMVTKNAAALTDAPRVERPEMQSLTPAQARIFLDTVRGDRLEALYAVALSLGLRQGEALGLRWQDVDLDAGSLHVRSSLQWLSGEGPKLVEPKTRQSRRSLPLTPNLGAQLHAHRQRERLERLAAGEHWQGEDWDLVFTNTRGGPLSKHTLIGQYKKHLERAGLPGMRFHDLRHSCASLLVAQGVHPRIVMEILGHSTITLTMNTYSHVLPQNQREAAALLDRLFSEERETAVGAD